MEVQKTQSLSKPSPGVPSPEDMALISRFTRRELSPEELYVFRTILCDNEIDRDEDRFTTEALEKLSELFLGKTGLFDHSGKSGDQVMRIYDTELVREERTTSQGESYTALIAKVYLLRGGENTELVREIDAGIKREVSVSCAMSQVLCSICGKKYMDCEHKKGLTYCEKRCHAVLKAPTDAFEFSFVAVPAQPAAGVLKKKRTKTSLQTDSSLSQKALEVLAAEGQSTREELRARAVQTAKAALPGLDCALFTEMCQNLEGAQLKQLLETLDAQLQKDFPLQRQLSSASAQIPGQLEMFQVRSHE